MPKIVDHDQRREEIVRAMWRVIRRRGVEGATVRAVAEEAGLSAGSLRYYFPSQAELISTAMQQVDARARERIAAIDPSGTVTERVTALIEAVLPLDAERREELEVWVSLSARAQCDDTLRPMSAAAYDDLESLSRSVLAELTQSGILRDDLDLDVEAVRLHGLIDGLAVHLGIHPERLTADLCRAAISRHLADLTDGRTLA